MKDYMKISDAFGFCEVTTQKIIGDAYELMADGYGHLCVVNTSARAELIAHSINSHDELVRNLDIAESTIFEVDRVISEMQRNGISGLDDIASEVERCIKRLSE